MADCPILLHLSETVQSHQTAAFVFLEVLSTRTCYSIQNLEYETQVHVTFQTFHTELSMEGSLPLVTSSGWIAELSRLPTWWCFKFTHTSRTPPSPPTPSPPTPSSGGASLLTHQWGHPGGLGQDGVVPGCHVGQRWIARPAEGPAEGLDVEFDPGERPPPFPGSPQCQRRPTPPRGEGHQRSHLPRAGCWPASQSLLIIVIVISGIALLEKDGCWWGPLGAKESQDRVRISDLDCGLHKKKQSCSFYT